MAKTLIQEMHESEELNKFEGGPGDSDLAGEPVNTSESELPKKETPVTTKEPEKKEPVKPVTEDKHPAEIAQEEEQKKAESAGKTGEPIKPSATPQKKFVSWEEAEKAALSAQQKITEQGQQLSAQTRELNELKKKFSLEADKEFVAQVTKETTEALGKIDPEDPEMIRKQTEILLASNQKMLDKKLESLSLPKPGQTETRSVQPDPNAQFVKYNQQVTSYLKEQALTEPEHVELFWMSFDHLIANDPAFKELANKTDDFGDNEATKKVVARVKKLVGFTEEKLKKLHQENKETSLETEALGRGSRKIDTVQEEEKPKTMIEQLSEAKKSARF